VRATFEAQPGAGRLHFTPVSACDVSDKKALADVYKTGAPVIVGIGAGECVKERVYCIYERCVYLCEFMSARGDFAA